MSSLRSFDRAFIAFAKRYYSPIARGALFVIFFLFGFLKLVGLSPADQLAVGFAQKMGASAFAQELFFTLAVVECVIGIMILFPKLTRIAILLILLHMVLVCSPLVLYPEAVWREAFVPNLGGQYIIKNVALVALALGLVATTPPLKKSKKR